MGCTTRIKPTPPHLKYNIYLSVCLIYLNKMAVTFEPFWSGLGFCFKLSTVAATGSEAIPRKRRMMLIILEDFPLNFQILSVQKWGHCEGRVPSSQQSKSVEDIFTAHCGKGDGQFCTHEALQDPENRQTKFLYT